MQQTETYKLNKPGMDDKFSVEPLNENADKLEGALSDLSARTVKLENCRVVLGAYAGSGTNGGQYIDLGERPVAVLSSMMNAMYSYTAFLLGGEVANFSSKEVMHLTDNGFWVDGAMNQGNHTFCFLALLGGWEEKNFT